MARITRVVPHLSLEEVKERMKNDPNPLYRERFLIIYTAQANPREAKDIAKDTGVSVAKVHKLIPLYNKIGVAAVETSGKGGRRREYMTIKEEQKMLETFSNRAEKGELVTNRQIKQEYEKRVGHKVHETTLYRLLGRHKWRKVMPRSHHPKANKQKQKDFEESFPEMVKRAEKTKDPEDNRATLIMAQDEGRFGRISATRRAWAPEHVRPLVPSQFVREYVYAYAAVAPEEGKMTFLVLPYSNTDMMNIFLKQVSKDFTLYFVIMQVDRASWHLSKDLVIPENIRLIPQPPYSPELNPTEHIWEEIREHGFYNHYYKSLDEVIQKLCNELMTLASDAPHVRSMTRFPHLRMVA
jgi:transposase